MKLIIINYPPSFYTRIIPFEKVCEITTFVDQDEGFTDKTLRVRIHLEDETIHTIYCGAPANFWEDLLEASQLHLDCFEEEKLSAFDKCNIEYADSLFKLEIKG